MVAQYSQKFTYLVVAGMAWSVWWIVQSPPSLVESTLMIAICYFITDLLSGLLHIILDNPRSLAVPVIKPLAEGFQRHHSNPDNIFEMSLYSHLYVMHLPLTLLFLAVLPLHDPLVYVTFLGMVVMLHVMQMGHRWAHMAPETVPRIVRALQAVRVLLPKSRHDQHHVPPYAKDFCIMTGMWNLPLNGVVKIVGGTTHWWMAVFFLVCLVPIGAALALSLT